jgi:hypothetical protein
MVMILPLFCTVSIFFTPSFLSCHCVCILRACACRLARRLSVEASPCGCGRGRLYCFEHPCSHWGTLSAELNELRQLSHCFAASAHGKGSILLAGNGPLNFGRQRTLNNGTHVLEKFLALLLQRCRAEGCVKASVVQAAHARHHAVRSAPAATAWK